MVFLKQEVFMSLLRKISILSFLGVVFTAAICAAEDGLPRQTSWSYTLGQGLHIGDTDLRLGGYLNIENENNLDQGKEEFLFDDLSLFLYGNLTGKARFFTEMEDSHFWQTDTDGRTRTEHKWQTERLYLDYLSSDRLNIRVGKFLTPVGTWNEVHADPLTWTVSRPVVTFAAFPEFTTGVQIFGNLDILDQDLSYALFYQGNESLDEDTGRRKTHFICGGRLRWFATPEIEMGIPFLYYREYGVGDRITLTGIDFSYRMRRMEIRSEATYSSVALDAGGWSQEYGYYIQGAYGITEKLFATLRHEYFNGRRGAGDIEAYSIGAAFKPRPQIVLKAEYQARSGGLSVGDISGDDFILTSFSVLF